MQWRMGLAEIVEMLRMSRLLEFSYPSTSLQKPPLRLGKSQAPDPLRHFSRIGENGIRRHTLKIR
jgi:hypothetical protein